jgi:7-carboxy-7-deazaguanine synthase
VVISVKVCEIFKSIQGEGATTGLPTTFVRLTGCNLRCDWCDTKYAYEEGEEMSIPDILAQVGELGNIQVCVTGGEPLFQTETPALVDRLIAMGYLVTLETNGSKSIEPLQCSSNLMISLDIKCPSSGESDEMVFSNLELLSPNDQLKFIIADKEDYEYGKKILIEHESHCNVIMTPVGGIKLKELAEWVLQDGLKVRVLPQLHKIIWGNERER